MKLRAASAHDMSFMNDHDRNAAPCCQVIIFCASVSRVLNNPAPMPPTEQFDFSTEVASQPGPFGRFYLQELINRGGMAEIWLATDQQNKAFALRRMIKTGRFDFASKKRFLRGCEILSRIHNHTLVIGYHEHGKIEGTPYVLMD